ncbi:hypothetical protein FACS1894217_15420 [Clostridia bacterium]|nr:hypothetical protein FACS1894217_15420 [Clostridia bacterium]
MKISSKAFLVAIIPILLLLFASCTNSAPYSDNPLGAKSKIESVVYEKWDLSSEGFYVGKSHNVTITDKTAVQKIKDMLADMVKDLPETEYNRSYTDYQHLTLNFTDGTSVAVEISHWSGVQIGKKHYDTTAEQFTAFQQYCDSVAT